MTNPPHLPFVAYNAEWHRGLLTLTFNQLCEPNAKGESGQHTPGPYAAGAYHAGWIALQALGLISGLALERKHMVADLRATASKRMLGDILIAGCADFGLLSVVHQALGAAIGSTRITVVDRCAYPLRLCQQYAQSAGFAINTLQADLCDLADNPVHDMVLGHSILSFFSTAQRGHLTRRLVSQLNPTGVLALYQSIRPGQPHAVLAYSTAETQNLCDEAVAAVPHHPELCRVGLDRWRDMVAAFCDAKHTFAVASAEETAALLQTYGLQVLVKPMFDSTHTTHRAATPQSAYKKVVFLCERKAAP